MSTFNPFTSDNSLDSFLQGLEQITPTLNTPSFDNQSPEIKKIQDELSVGQATAELDDIFNLDTTYSDFTTKGSSVDAATRALEIRQLAKTKAQELERKKAEELGLIELQNTYQQLLSIPGATEFEATRQRLAQLEPQIQAKQAEVADYISADNKGNIVGQLANQFADVETLAAKWDIVTREREKQEQRDFQLGRTVDQKESVKEKARIKSEISLGGPSRVDNLIRLTGMTSEEILDANAGGRLDQGILALENYENLNGPIDLPNSVIYGDEATRAVARRAARQSEFIEPAEMDKLISKAQSSTNIQASLNSLVERRKEQDSKFELNKQNKQDLEIQAAAISMNTALEELKTTIKEKHITPDKWLLDNNPQAIQDDQIVARTLVSQFPEAFTYTSDRDKARENLTTLLQGYQDAFSGSEAPPFGEVYQLMTQSMVNRMNQGTRGLNSDLIGPTDPIIQDLQLAMLTAQTSQVIPKNASDALTTLSEAQEGIIGNVGRIMEPAEALQNVLQLILTRSLPGS